MRLLHWSQNGKQRSENYNNVGPLSKNIITDMSVILQSIGWKTTMQDCKVITLMPLCVYLVWYFWTSVAGNSIKRVSGLHGGSFANLVTLELRGNKLETTDGIDLPNLRHLYMVVHRFCSHWTHLMLFFAQRLYKCTDPEESWLLSMRSLWPGPKCHQTTGGFRETGASHHPSPSRQPARNSRGPQPQHEVSPVPQCQVHSHTAYGQSQNMCCSRWVNN